MLGMLREHAQEEETVAATVHILYLITHVDVMKGGLEEEVSTADSTKKANRFRSTLSLARERMNELVPRVLWSHADPGTNHDAALFVFRLPAPWDTSLSTSFIVSYRSRSSFFPKPTVLHGWTAREKTFEGQPSLLRPSTPITHAFQRRGGTRDERGRCFLKGRPFGVIRDSDHSRCGQQWLCCR